MSYPLSFFFKSSSVSPPFPPCGSFKSLLLNWTRRSSSESEWWSTWPARSETKASESAEWTLRCGEAIGVLGAVESFDSRRFIELVKDLRGPWLRWPVREGSRAKNRNGLDECPKYWCSSPDKFRCPSRKWHNSITGKTLRVQMFFVDKIHGSIFCFDLLRVCSNIFNCFLFRILMQQYIYFSWLLINLFWTWMEDNPERKSKTK